MTFAAILFPNRRRNGYRTINMKFYVPKRMSIRMQIELENIAASTRALKDNTPEISAFPHDIQSSGFYSIRIFITEFDFKIVFVGYQADEIYICSNHCFLTSLKPVIPRRGDVSPIPAYLDRFLSIGYLSLRPANLICDRLNTIASMSSLGSSL